MAHGMKTIKRESESKLQLENPRQALTKSKMDGRG